MIIHLVHTQNFAKKTIIPYPLIHTHMRVSGGKKRQVLGRIVFMDNMVDLLEHLLISYSAGIYFLKVNNRNTRVSCEICSQLTTKTQNDTIGVFLVSLLLTLHIFKPWSTVSIDDFQYAIAGWVYSTCQQLIFLFFWNYSRCNDLFVLVASLLTLNIFHSFFSVSIVASNR